MMGLAASVAHNLVSYLGNQSGNVMPPKRSLSPKELPEGFLYQPAFLSEHEEAELLGILQGLPFAAFDFHGYKAKRRVVEYGWEYDFGSRKATTTRRIPEFLLPFRERAAAFAGLSPEDLVEAVVTEYPAGAPIGWHRDVPQFEVIIGISLASAARMRFKPYKRGGRKSVGAEPAGKILSLILEPRSIYMMRGATRWKFQHSIPAVESLRYSITFRSLREKREQRAA
jgi:alkylated DNA repair dioxygenase AlkB